MIVSIAQPTVFPWLGYFNIIKNSDIFVFLDNVKFEKSSWQMRNKIKEISKDKEREVWIRIPTKLEKTETLIKNVLIDNSQKWKESHIKAFKINYGKSYDSLSFLTDIYSKEWEKLGDFNVESITNCCRFLQIKTKLVKASDLDITGKKGQLVLNICKKLGATEYLSTIGSKDYLENDKEIFKEANIEITYHNYTHPIYKQRGKIFLEKLSILDLLFNELENAKNFI